MKIGAYSLKPYDVLLVLVPVALAGSFLGWNETWLFVLSALAVIPLAGIMGTATEELALHMGPRAGGLLNATLGNAAELIITIFAIQAGLLDLVKASITGSILGNVLLVLGLSLLLGGLKNGVQVFDRRQANVNGTMLVLAVAGLAVPSLFIASIRNGPESFPTTESLSMATAVVLILIYVLSIVYSFTLKRGEPQPGAVPPTHHAAWSVPTALVVLALATGGIAWLSEILVGSVEHTVEALGWSEFFIGVIIIPLVGNVAEHIVAVQVALKNKMELSLAVSLGSSLQIALFVAPLLVFISLAMGNPMQLAFNQFEVAALLASSLIAALIALDGESNWLEGAMLLVLYAIIGVAFFFL